MKRFLEIAIITLLFLGFLFTMGCTKSKVSSPETVTKEFFNSLKSADFEKASKFTVNTNDTALKNEMIGDATNKRSMELAKLIFNHFTYKIGNSTINGEKAAVPVVITSLDMVKIVATTINELMPTLLAGAFGGMSEQNADSILYAYLENSLNDTDAPQITTNTNVNLIKVANEWKISTENDDVVNAITGNFLKAFDRFGKVK